MTQHTPGPANQRCPERRARLEAEIDYCRRRMDQPMSYDYPVYWQRRIFSLEAELAAIAKATGAGEAQS